MKIDKLNLWHWLALLRLGGATALAILIRPFQPERKRPLVLLYGHKLNGNLLALYRHLKAHPSAGLDVSFLGLDKRYVEKLRRDEIDAVCGICWSGLRALAYCSSIVSSHGLHSMQPLIRFSSIRFVDVWHGIPYKGFDADDFRVQQCYDEVWVASESQQKLWKGKFGFDPTIVHATGYARTDQLVAHETSQTEAQRSLGLDPTTCGKTILFAPTWRQDDKGRTLYPFSCSERDFLSALSTFALTHNATVLLRSHLNSGEAPTQTYSNVVALPGIHYPDTEIILQASDVLVCDWSSIAFDFLLLDRPTIFLDVPAPFRKGFSLGPEYRFGSIAHDTPELLRTLEVCMERPSEYWQVQAASHQSIKSYVYGDRADGQAAARCTARLQALVGISGG